MNASKLTFSALSRPRKRLQPVILSGLAALFLSSCAATPGIFAGLQAAMSVPAKSPQIVPERPGPVVPFQPTLHGINRDVARVIAKHPQPISGLFLTSEDATQLRLSNATIAQRFKEWRVWADFMEKQVNPPTEDK